MDFSIIIPVRNRPDEIRRCVASCYAQRYDPTRYEVIVVDNGSTDMTAREAAGAGARVISEPVPNRCLARNAGARVARGRWLAFIDSDCEADPGWLAALAVAVARAEPTAGGITSTGIGAIAGEIISAPPSSGVEAYIDARGWLDQRKFLAGRGRFRPLFAATANLAVSAWLFRDRGGFNPDLCVAAEDADLCLRLARKGWTIEYAPDARVIHHHRATLRGMLRQAYNYGIGSADFFALHRGRARVWIEPQWYVWAMKGLIKSPWVALTARGPARAFAFYDFLTNLAQAAGRIRGGIKHRLLIL